MSDPGAFSITVAIALAAFSVSLNIAFAAEKIANAIKGASNDADRND